MIEILNAWGDRALDAAWPMLWQSSLLIASLLATSFALRRRVRPAVLHALWLTVLIKLMLPPSLALPTGAGWWLRLPEAASPAQRPTTLTFTTGPAAGPRPLPVAAAISSTSPARVSTAGWAFLFSAGVSAGLLVWALVRWRAVVRAARQAAPAPDWVAELLLETQRLAGVAGPIKLRVMTDANSPAVCGLVRPAILIPRHLVEQLNTQQLRAILLHELIHVRRRDVWFNCIQTLVQIVYWWHPLVWVANSRLRETREEAVDDAVMTALRGEAACYAPTLLQVAKLALHRPASGLALLGILESQRPLKRRIHRLLEPRKAPETGLALASALSIVAFAAVAIPMGQPPVSAPTPAAAPVSAPAVIGAQAKAPALVRYGQLFYEMGALEVAEKAFRDALQQDPTNQAASHYLNLIQEQRSGRTANAARKSTTQATTASPPQLYTRAYRIDPNTLMNNLAYMGFLDTVPPVGRSKSTGELLRDFLVVIGLELKPPKSLFFKDRTGDLLVRATLGDLDLIESAVHVLNTPPTQVHIKAKFLEVPGQFVGGLFTNQPAAGLGLMRSLNPREAEDFLTKLQSEPGVAVISAPQVTTLSGRQAQVQIASVQTIATNINPKALTLPGISVEAEEKGELFSSEQVSCGPTLDITPWADDNPETIQLVVSAGITEFLGYEKSTNSTTAYVSGKPKVVQLPLPKFSLRQAKATVVVANGHSLLLGCQEAHPGRVGGPDDSKTKQLLVLLTATTMDAAGNPTSR